MRKSYLEVYTDVGTDDLANGIAASNNTAVPFPRSPVST